MLKGEGAMTNLLDRLRRKNREPEMEPMDWNALEDHLADVVNNHVTNWTEFVSLMKVVDEVAMQAAEHVSLHMSE